MRKFFEKQLMRVKLKTGCFLSRLAEEERGDTNFVAIIIIIVIVLGIAGIFREQLEDAVYSVMGQLLEFVG